MLYEQCRWRWRHYCERERPLIEILKSITQLAAARIVRVFWRISGRRRVRLFGLEWNLVSESGFSMRPGCGCPRGRAESQIVRYADFVQMHAAFRYLSGLDHALVIVDVGAYHGAYAVPFGVLARVKGGNVLAVEPNPISLQVLRRNVKLNGLDQTVRVHSTAVSDVPGDMYIDANESQSSLSSHKSNGACKVQVVTMSDILVSDQIVHVDLLMIDVEGAELNVLRGFPWDRVSVGMILCELHPNDWPAFGYGDAEFATFLHDRGLIAVDAYWRTLNTAFGKSYIGPCRLIRATQL